MAQELYPARGHPNGSSLIPHFQIRRNDICPARGHIKGSSSIPWYEIR